MDTGAYNDNIDAIPSFLADPTTEGKSKKKKSGGFQSMNLAYPIYKAILGKGFNVPTPIQRKTIPAILEGRDVIASSKTGSGKTAAYMIPVLNRLKAHSTIVGTRAVILLPTRELALQTAAVFKQFAKFTDLIHAVIVGGHGFEGQYESLASNPDVIIATPGRLWQHLEETNFALTKVEFLVVDEADHMIEMGFEEQLRSIVRKMPATRQTIMLSATIPEQVSAFAKVGLKDYVFVKLDSEYTIPDTMKLNFFLTKSNTKLSALLYFIKEKLNLEEKTIIFAATRYHVDFLIEVLKKYEVNSVGIYGKMDQLSRKETIMKFRRNDVNILVVTDLAARGIDIPFVNNVINWDFPSKPKSFIHRSGRTARAGRIGYTYTFLAPEEVLYLADLKIYIGRKFSTEGDINDFSIAHYGMIPEYILDNYEESMKHLLDEDIEIDKMHELCNRAIKLFKRTRSSASKSSIRGARELNQTSVHVLFHDERYNPDMEKMLEKIRNYKPQQSYLEFKNEAGEIKMASSALTFINKARAQAERFQKKQTRLANERLIKNLDDSDSDRPRKLEDDDDDDDNDEEIEVEDGEGGDDNEDDEAEQVGQEAKKSKTLLGKRQFDKSKGDWEINSQKKPKRSQISDFRHPTQFLSYEKSKENPLADNNKIGEDDIVAFVVADEADDLQKKQKYTWDKTKKKYVQKNNDSSRMRKDKEDKFMKEGKNKDLFQKWQKRNHMGYQKVGEMENKEMTSKARQMFSYRKRRYGGEEGYNQGGGRYQGGNQGGKGGKGGNNNGRRRGSELKDAGQILKGKKKSATNKILNMNKGKRKHMMSGGAKGGKGGKPAGKPGKGGKPASKGFKGGKGGKGGNRRR